MAGPYGFDGMGQANKRVARDRRPLADLLKPNGDVWAAARGALGR
jgi:hypothetical protein